MNAIAAHKDELKKLLKNLSGDPAVLGITFVAFSGCLYHAPRYELLRHQRPRQSAAAANKRRIKYGTNIDSELRTLLRAA